MQISQVTPPINAVSNFIPAGTLVNEKSYSERNTLNINYSDQNYSVNLSISRSSTYRVSTYTAEGVMNDLTQGNFENALILPPEDSVIDKNIPEFYSNALELLEAAMEKYYELISKQVEYLLREISEQRYEKSYSTDTGINRNTSTVSDARSYTLYSRQTFIISQNITIKVNITESDYFSSEKTAERIINFVLSFYDGGDRQEFAAMVRKAVMKGYDEAMKALGDFLPPEAHETIETVNRTIDDFANGKDMNISA